MLETVAACRRELANLRTRRNGLDAEIRNAEAAYKDELEKAARAARPEKLNSNNILSYEFIIVDDGDIVEHFEFRPYGEGCITTLPPGNGRISHSAHVLTLPKSV